MTTSIFGADLSMPLRSRPDVRGAVHGCTAEALYRALAEHFCLPFSDVKEMIAPIIPHALPRLQTVEGWALFGEYVALSTPESHPFQPTVH